MKIESTYICTRSVTFRSHLSTFRFSTLKTCLFSITLNFAVNPFLVILLINNNLINMQFIILIVNYGFAITCTQLMSSLFLTLLNVRWAKSSKRMSNARVVFAFLFFFYFTTCPFILTLNRVKSGYNFCTRSTLYVSVNSPYGEKPCLCV